MNGNAADAEGDIVSPHLTGATVDLAKSGMTASQKAWMRRALLPLEQSGVIDVEEEFRQACFHITVYKEFAPEMFDQLVEPELASADAEPAPIRPQHSAHGRKRHRPARDENGL